ncbi:peptide ABC transporter ATP-binding protein [Clostridia bacterium]|nr:peptide ABC transporter ATP-binding protein [Clostridia bacterium]
MNAAMNNAMNNYADASSRQPLLSVDGLKQYFPLKRGHVVRAVDGVTFQIYRNETYGLVGESGSGKSTIGRTVIRLYEPTAGNVEFNGRCVSGRLNEHDRKMLRTKMQMIYQDPMSCLNPRKKALDIIAQGLDLNGFALSRGERSDLVYAMLEKVGLSPDHANRYPHQFSGGQRQRIGIARALILKPDLIIADEAISALDVSIQAQIVNLMRTIQRETKTSYMFIAHDLSMVKYLSDRIGVLHRGHLVETGTKSEIFDRPLHPYTRSLIQAIPHPNPIYEKNRTAKPYDMNAQGIVYNEGQLRLVEGTHFLLSTEAEFGRWTSV